MAAQTLLSLRPAPLAIVSADGEPVTVGGAPVVAWERRADNGLIHTLGAVIPLPEDTPRGTCSVPIEVAGYGFWIGDTADGLPTQLATCGQEARGPEQVFRWIAPADGRVCFDNAASDYDTVLHARTGRCSSRRSEIACNDDFGGRLQSAIEVEAVADQEYFILVDGFGDATGRFVLEAREGACE